MAMAKIEIIINGQSGEYCIGSLTKEQYEFWNKTEDYLQITEAVLLYYNHTFVTILSSDEGKGVKVD